MKRLGTSMGAARSPLAIFLVLAAAGLVYAADTAWDEPKASWRNGPVRELLTPDEDKAFKALKTDEERAKAIADFWMRRDPTPGTPENEFHADFARRVEGANSQFGEGTGPGWSTDRGRLLLLAGFPADRKSGIAEGAEQETWSYTQFASDPALADDKALLAKITFLKQESGEFKASPEALSLDSLLRKLDPAALAKLTAPKGAAPAKPKAAAPHAGAAPGAAVAPAGAPAAPAAMPPGIERLKAAATAAEPKADIAMVPLVRYFMAEGGSTRAVIVIAIKKSDIQTGADGKPRTVLYARLLPEGEGAAPIEFYEQELFALYDDAGEGWLKYAFGWTLSKKSYELRIGASDGAEGRMATAVQTLNLPDFKSDALLLSSVTLARVSQPAAPGDKPESEDAFRLGSLRLVPWVKPAIGPKDDLAFFYDVYHAKRDVGTNKPQLDVSYQIAKKEPAGWKPRGHLDEAGKAEERLGYTIPAESLAAWPAGDYKLTVVVKDRIANASATSSVEFSIVK